MGASTRFVVDCHAWRAKCFLFKVLHQFVATHWNFMGDLAIKNLHIRFQILGELCSLDGPWYLRQSASHEQHQ